MTKHVALYCRLSPRPDGSYEGVDLQERWGRAYAAQHWPTLPVEVFADAGISAANGDRRPEYERLREWVAAGRVAHLWAVEQTRLERREEGWFALAAELDAAGITELHTNRDGIVRVRDEVAGIKAVLAAAEARKISGRTNDALAERAAEGRPHGGRTFGYRAGVDAKGRKTLEVVDSEADVLRDAAEKVLAGWSLTNVARHLDAQGVRGANGAKITYKTLGKMLTNPTVAGQRVYRGEIVGQGTWLAILDDTTWRAVRQRLGAPREVQTSRGDAYEIGPGHYGHRSRRRFLLTGGLAVCGVCGGPLGAQNRRVHGRALAALYFCRPGHCVGVNADPLEATVRDRLITELNTPAFLDALAAGDQTDDRDRITGRLRAAEERRASLSAQWARGELTDTEWATARRELAAVERQAYAELAALPPPLVAVDVTAVADAWPVMTLDERREIVSLFIARVVVHRAANRGARVFDPGRVDIDWRWR